MRGKDVRAAEGKQHFGTKHVRSIVMGFLGALTFLTVAFTAAFLLTGWIYARYNITLPILVEQVINSLVGLIFVIMVAGTIGWLTRGKQLAQQRSIFLPIVDALGRIAQGDFSVRLQDGVDFGDRLPMGELVQSVNTLAKELNQMEEMRQEFISTVSHEIQSPLTSIRGFAQALQNEHLTAEERAHYLNIIETESTRLSKLSDNLLALALFESENYQMEPKPFRLDVQIRDVVLACEPQWKEKDIEMQLEQEPVTITADEDLLRQVWTNLIYNSIKFTPPHGRIWIALHPHGEMAEFRIADTGIGIAAQDREHVFERFFKADKARDRSKGGNGLGLAIAKTIVNRHHGMITVESVVDKGTTFRVELPLAHTALTPPAPLSQRARGKHLM